MLNVPRLRMSDTRASGLTKNIGLHFMTVAPLSTTVPCDLGHDFLLLKISTADCYARTNSTSWMSRVQ